MFDADGVLTDGTIYLLPDGREMKAFNALDGTGIKYLERAGIATAILSGRRSAAVNHRAREVGTRYVLQGYKRKLAGLAKLARLAKVPPERMCFVGDDLPDIPVMAKVGLRRRGGRRSAGGDPRGALGDRAGRRPRRGARSGREDSQGATQMALDRRAVWNLKEVRSPKDE